MVKPIFILSLPRSGSTLLQRLLMMSGYCSSLGESSLLLRFLGGDSVLARRATYWEFLVEMGLEDARAAWSGFDQAYYAGVQDLMNRIYMGLSDGKEWFIDKTPRYSLIAEEIIKVFPDAKFIVLWRHPLAIAASMSKTFLKGRWALDDYENDLYEGFVRLDSFCRKHSDCICQLRYEDLVSEPVDQLSRLGEYLGWDSLPCVLKDELVTTAGGRLGDPTGVKKYSKLSDASCNVWHEQYNNWFRRRWARKYVSGDHEKMMENLGYCFPPELMQVSGRVSDIWGGVLDWKYSTKRRQRKFRSPNWVSRVSKKFYRQNGYYVSFR